mgnify:CR=1 FL=1
MAKNIIVAATGASGLPLLVECLKIIKENEDFRRFNYRTADKVYKEFLLFAIGRNINKYHRFLQDKLHKFEGKTEQKTA